MQPDSPVFVREIIDSENRNAKYCKTLNDLLCFQINNFFKDKIFIDKLFSNCSIFNFLIQYFINIHHSCN